MLPAEEEYQGGSPYVGCVSEPAPRNREYLPKQGMNTGRIESIRWLERGSGKMSKRPNPFECKGKKKTRRPRELLWRDGLAVSKWWRWGESNPRPKEHGTSLYRLSSRLRFEGRGGV